MRDLCASKGTAGRPCRCSPPPPTLPTPPLRLPEYRTQRVAGVASNRWIPVLLRATLALLVRVSESTLPPPHGGNSQVGVYGHGVDSFRK
jgi:hypothetical protein